MNVLWCSNSPLLPSGYANQTALFVPRLKAAGHGAAVFAICGQDSVPSRTADGTMILPRVAHTTGRDVLRGHAEFSGANVILTLIDPHVLDPETYGQFPWIAWAPVDSAPIPASTVTALRGARWIWAMSRFGERELHRAGFDNVTYVPHGVDEHVFAPQDREAARSVLAKVTGAAIDAGTFLVAMNAANRSQPSRKGFYEAFAAFKQFSDQCPSARLYVHAETTGIWGGEDLHAIVRLVDLDPAKILFPPQYPLVCGMFGQDYLAAVYNAADVYLSASHGEGFGLPLVEAALCGCPVIAPRNSAQTEIVQPRCQGAVGWLTEVTPYMPSDGTEWGRPTVANLEFALTRARAHLVPELPATRPIAREHALAYAADRVFAQHMKPALDQIAKELA